MQIPQQSYLSSSTCYRYTRYRTKQQLKSYINFKTQYQNYLSNQKIQLLKQIYPHAILGYNINQHLVILDRIGSIRPNQLLKIIDYDTLTFYTFQRLIYICQHVLNQKDKIIWIIDLNGKIMQLASKKMYNSLQKIITNAQLYFPGILHKLYFINTPMLFDAILNKLSSVIQPQTLPKLAMYSDDINQMINEVDLTLLPKCIGGCVPDIILQKMEHIKTNNKKQYINLKCQQQKQQQQDININQLRIALSNLKIGISHSSISSTPLNTQSDQQISS